MTGDLRAPNLKAFSGGACPYTPLACTCFGTPLSVAPLSAPQVPYANSVRVLTPGAIPELRHWCAATDNAQKNNCIRESVDFLCRDGADAQYMQYLKQ